MTLDLTYGKTAFPGLEERHARRQSKLKQFMRYIVATVKPVFTPSSWAHLIRIMFIVKIVKFYILKNKCQNAFILLLNKLTFVITNNRTKVLKIGTSQYQYRFPGPENRNRTSSNVKGIHP